MPKEKIFPNGIYYNVPNENAPDFIKGSISVNVNVFDKWIQQNQNLINSKGYVRLDILTSRQGKLYLSVNTYQPNQNDDIQF